MKTESNNRFTVNSETVPRIAGVATLVAGFVVIIGWILDIPILTRPQPVLIPMNSTSAMAFVIAGMSLLLHSEQGGGTRKLTARVLAWLVGLMGLLNVLQYAFSWNVGIDQLLFVQTRTTGDVLHPGQMSLMTASSFCLLGLALVMTGRKRSRGDLLAQVLAFTVGLIALIALLAYVYGLSDISGYPAHNRMALYTAITFLVSVVGVVYLQRDVGIMTVLTGKGLGSLMARRLIVAAILVPVGLAWLAGSGERWGWYGEEFSDVVIATAGIITLVSLIWIIGRSLNKVESDRKNVDAALLESEERYRSLVHNLAEGIGIVDIEERFRFANPRAEAIFGVTAGGLVGRSLREFVEGSEFESIREQTSKRLQGETARYEIQISRPDGAKRFLLATVSPLLDEGRTFIGALGVFLDQTDRKMAEEEMLTLRKAVDTSGEAIFLTDREGVITSVNPGFTTTYGYTAAEVVGKVTPRILNSGTLSAEAFEVFWKNLLSGQEVRRELRNKRKDGTLVDIEGSASPIFDEKNNIIGFMGIQRDITERKLTEVANKRAQEALRKSEERFKQIAESAGEWIWETDADGLYTFSSSAVQTILGYHPEEIVGKKHFYDFFTPDVRDELRRAALAEFARKDVVRSVINPNVHKNGSTVILETNCSPILDQHGNLLGYRGADTDITARKRAEDSLKESFSLLQATLQSTVDGILVVDRQGRITSYNKGFAAMWRLPEDVVTSRDDDRAVNHVLEQLSDPETFVSKVRDLYAHPEESSFDVLKFKDGRVFERYSQPQRVDGKPVGRVWSFRDVTEREKAQHKIRLLAQALSSTKDCISVTDLEDRIMFVNSAFLSTYGYTRDELLGRPISIVRSAKTLPEVANRILSGTLAGGWYGEIFNCRKDGSEFPIELWTSAVSGDSGEVVATVGVARDITGRKLEQQERESLINELKTALESVRTLSGLLPICAHCKKIRDDKGYWNQLEQYIVDHTEATLTHGLCPQCAEQYFPDYRAHKK